MIRTFLALALASVVVAACGGSDEGDGSDGSGPSGGDPTSGAGSGSGGDDSGSSGSPTGSSGAPSGSGAGGSTSAGSGGTGGMGSGGAPPLGACTNDPDMTILEMGMVESQVEACAQESFGQEPATTDCIKQATNLSDPCVACFAETVACTVDNCIGDCIGGQSPECQACMDANCTPAFEACSGLDSDA